jgi:hypothetical protein
VWPPPLSHHPLPKRGTSPQALSQLASTHPKAVGGRPRRPTWRSLKPGRETDLISATDREGV